MTSGQHKRDFHHGFHRPDWVDFLYIICLRQDKVSVPHRMNMYLKRAIQSAVRTSVVWYWQPMLCECELRKPAYNIYPHGDLVQQMHDRIAKTNRACKVVGHGYNLTCNSDHTPAHAGLPGQFYAQNKLQHWRLLGRHNRFYYPRRTCIELEKLVRGYSWLAIFRRVLNV